MNTYAVVYCEIVRKGKITKYGNVRVKTKSEFSSDERALAARGARMFKNIHNEHPCSKCDAAVIGFEQA